MFSKFGIAVAMLAVGSFLALDPATAQGRNGGKNGGKKIGKVAKQAKQTGAITSRAIVCRQHLWNSLRGFRNGEKCR